MSPYVHEEESHELTGAVAYNKWVVAQNEDTTYVQTYPRGSLSIVHCAYVCFGRFDGFGGIELINAPTDWWNEEVSGIVGILRPYTGVQYCLPYTTVRLNIAPFHFYYGISGDGSGFVPLPSAFTWYQITVLLHNPRDAALHYWLGIRNAPGGSGFLVGTDLLLTTSVALRAEYSYLLKPVLPPLFFREEIDEIDGSVHYVTVGMTIQIK